MAAPNSAPRVPYHTDGRRQAMAPAGVEVRTRMAEARSTDSPNRTTHAERVLSGRIGAHKVHAAGLTNTAPARAAFLSKFDREVLEAAAARGESLTPEERARRAAHARKAAMTRLALRSAQARRRRRA